MLKAMATAKRLMLWLGVAAGVALLLWGLIWLAKQAPEPGTLKNRTVNADDWVSGNRAAKVVLIEYGDFQCPACAFYYPIVEQLMDKNSDKMQFVFRHFPLGQHPNARPAAYAAQAAGRQDKFWEMYDLIYYQQNDWAGKNSQAAGEIFLGYARTLELDLDKYNADNSSDQTKQKVQSDYDGGIASGVNSTPTFYLNGQRVQPPNYDQFQKLIDEAVAANP